MSVPTGLVLPRTGGGQLTIISPVNKLSLSSAAVPVANTSYFQKFRVDRPRRLTTIHYFLNTATSGNVIAGIFHRPVSTLTALSRTASTAAGIVNTNLSISLLSGVDAVPGVDYWVALAADNATIQFWRTNSYARVLAFLDEEFAAVASNYALADGVTLTDGGANYQPWIGVS